MELRITEGIVRHRGRGYQVEKVAEEETVDANEAVMDELEEETTQSIFTSTPPPVNKKRQIEDASNVSELDQTHLSFPDQVHKLHGYSLPLDRLNQLKKNLSRI